MDTLPVPASDVVASHPYTCNTCQVAYRNIDLQKGHMKSDWHRYNLKRRVASLPPISADIFTEKVLRARAASTAAADKAYFERVCESCDKTYYSENAYQNHLLSQKHKQNESTTRVRPEDENGSVISSTFSLGQPVPTTSQPIDSDAEDEFNHVVEGLQSTKLAEKTLSPVKRPSHPQPELGSGADSTQRGSNSTTPVQSTAEPVWTVKSCIFCNYQSPTVLLNAHHMERFHGMFIPEKSYLSDLDGLIQHLQERVGVDHECLYCGKMKNTVFAVQTHMKDTGHCKIPFTTEQEQLDIGDYYDFRSTYSDEEEDEDDSDDELEGEKSREKSGGARLGAKRASTTTHPNGRDAEGDEDGEGWETDSSASSLDSDDLTAVPAEGHLHQFERLDKHRHHAHHNPQQRHQRDGWHSHAHKHTHAVFYDDYEMHLPSGKAVGHRSLNKYYRQNLTNYPTAEERAERLAIEAADGHGEESESRALAVNGRREERQVVPRGAMGLTGVSDQKKENVRRAERRGRKQEAVDHKETAYKYGKKLNNHKAYYYRYTGGG